jgi:hypothetical protein
MSNTKDVEIVIVIVITSELQKLNVSIQSKHNGYKVVNNSIFITITTRNVEISVSYLINRIRLVY